MAQNPYREQLLAQALKSNRGATRKISRLKTSVEVIVSGTEYDPRKPARLLKRYTTKQLEAFIGRTAQFNDRGTQFVPDAHHRPIPAAEWKDYKHAEQLQVGRAKARLDAVGDIVTSSGTETIRQRRDKMRSDRKLAGNPTVQDPYSPRQRESTMIENRKALKKLTRDAKKKAQPGWDNKELKRQIGEFSQMIGRLGDNALADRVLKLTPSKFRVLWNDTKFPDALSQQYEKAMLGLIDDTDKPWYAELIHNAFFDAEQEISWVEKLDLTGDDPADIQAMKQARRDYKKKHRPNK